MSLSVVTLDASMVEPSVVTCNNDNKQKWTL